MSRWSLFFLLVPVAGAALFAAGEYLGWSLPPVQSTMGRQIDHMYYMILAITGVAFIFTQLGIAFLVYYYQRPRPGRESQGHRGLLDVMLWLIVPLAGFAFLLYSFPMPTEARLWMAVALCVGWPLLLSLMVTGRTKRGTGTAVYSHGNSSLEVVWTIVPAGIFLFIAFYQYPLWKELRYPRTRPADVVPVRVIGRQFEWRMVYAGKDGQLDTPDDLHFPGELHVVKGKEVWIDLRAMDVIHSFFLPMHRVKQDAVPGLTIPVWFDCEQSTWEFQVPFTPLLPQDILAPAALAQRIQEASTPALAYLKEKTGGAIENPTTASLANALNKAIESTGFFDPSRFDVAKLPLELRQLAKHTSDDALRRLLDRKLLDSTLQDLVQPVGGQFDIVCAELCGWGHYKMKGRLVVHESESEFQEWLAEQIATQESVQ